MPTYATEPRVQFDLRDQGILPINDGTTTDRVLIIGVAVDGPNEGPVAISSMDDLARIFGPTNKRVELGDQPSTQGFNGNWLVRTAREAFNAGCRDIVVRRVGGTNAVNHVSGYNYVTNDAVEVATGGGPVNLTYGGFPTPNDGIANTVLTVAAVNGSAVRLSGTPTSMTAYVDWFAYLKGHGLDARIVSTNGMTVVLSDDLSSYITAGDAVQVHPKNNFRVFSTDGNEYNPFNFVITAGTATVNSTIEVVTSPVTIDPRYSLAAPATTGATVYVHYLMKPDKVITLQSRTASDIYNSRGTVGQVSQDGCWLAVTQTDVTVSTMALYVPKFRSSPLTVGNVQNYALRFELSGVGTYDDLVARINGAGQNTSIRASLATSAAWNGVAVEINGVTGGNRGLTNTYSGRVNLLDSVSLSTAAARFTGGSSGLEITGDALYNILTGGSDPDNQGILEEIEELQTDFRVIAGVNADDTVAGEAGKWAEVLARHCWEASRGGQPSRGVIGVKAQRPNAVSAGEINTRVAQLTTAGGGGLADLMTATFSVLDEFTGTLVDAGAYIDIVAGPDGLVSDSDIGLTVSNLAGAFAGLMAATAVNRSPTQLPMVGVRGLLYEYTRKQRHLLTQGVGYADLDRGGAYTTFRTSPDTGALVVHSGETAASRKSQFNKSGVIRIVQTAEALVARAARKYIGGPNIVPVHQAMENECKKVLEALTDVRALAGTEGVGYQLSVTSTGSDATIGKVTVEMSLRPATEIRWIYVPVTVNQ